MVERKLPFCSDLLTVRKQADQLIKPVQRIPRYTLLLKELRKHTEEAMDGVALDAAIYAIEEISRRSEVVIADADGVTRLLDLQSKLRDNVIDVAHRRLISQAPVTIQITSSSLSKRKQRILAVCSDVIFILKQRRGSAQMKLAKSVDIATAFVFGVSKEGSTGIDSPSPGGTLTICLAFAGSFSLSFPAHKAEIKCATKADCDQLVESITRGRMSHAVADSASETVL